MDKKISGWSVVTACVLLWAAPIYAQNGMSSRSEPSLHIDIPTKLDKANVVVDVGHAVYLGDTLFVLGDMNLLADDLREWNAKGQIIMVFHGDAAYLVLNDETYNSNRHVATGNPYKKILNGLMEKGVHLELCGATAKGNHWGNANLLPGGAAGIRADLPINAVTDIGKSRRRKVMKMWQIGLLGLGLALAASAANKPADNKNGIVTIPSSHSVDETVAKLKSILQSKGITLFIVVDHSGEAAKVGMKMPNTKLVIFGNPKGGTPLMLAAPSVAIDLPLKILVAEDTQGKVWVSHNSPEYLAERHGLPQDLIQNIAVVGTLATEAAQ